MQLSLPSGGWVRSVLLPDHLFELPLLVPLLPFSSSLKLGVDQGIQLAFCIVLFTGCRLPLPWLVIESIVRSAPPCSLIQNRWPHSSTRWAFVPGTVCVVVFFKWVSCNSSISGIRVACVKSVPEIIIGTAVPLVRLASGCRLVLHFFDVDVAAVVEVPARPELLKHVSSAFGVGASWSSRVVVAWLPRFELVRLPTLLQLLHQLLRIAHSLVLAESEPQAARKLLQRLLPLHAQRKPDRRSWSSEAGRRSLLSQQGWSKVLLLLPQLLQLRLHLLLHGRVDALLEPRRLRLHLRLDLGGHQFVDVLLERAVAELELDVLLSTHRLLHLLAQLLLRQHPHSLVDPQQPLEAVLVVVDHVFVAVLFDRQLFAQGKVDLVHRLLESAEELCERLLDFRDDVRVHGFSELANNHLLHVKLRDLVAMGWEVLEERLELSLDELLDLREDLLVNLGVEAAHFVCEERDHDFLQLLSEQAVRVVQRKSLLGGLLDGSLELEFLLVLAVDLLIQLIDFLGQLLVLPR